MRLRAVVTALYVLCAPTAQAWDVSLDLFGTPAARIETENRDTGEEGRLRRPDGFGAGLIVWPGEGPLFFSAEYAQLEARTPVTGVPDRVQSRLEQARLGIGLINRSAFYTRLEVIRTESRARFQSATAKTFKPGLGVHAGVAGAIYPRLLGGLEAGYVDLDVFADEDEQTFGRGLQASARAEIPLFPALQLFTEYRHQRLRLTRQPPKLVADVGEARVGLRLNF